VCVIAWLFVMTTIYFWAHKPFDSAVVSGLGGAVLNIAVWLVIVWIGTALGLWLASRPLAELPAGPRLAFASGIGLGVVSLGVLCLGLVGLLTRPVAWGGVLVLGTLLRRHMVDVVRCLRLLRFPHPENRFQRWVLIYCCASLVMAFLTALAPPTGWDSLVYHLTGPKLFTEAGHITHGVDLPYLGFPQLMEMQFTLGLLLAGEGVAPLLHFGYGLLAVILVAWLARRVFGADAAWIAVGALLSVPTLIRLMTRAYVDISLLFYATAAFCGLICWRDAARHGAVQTERGWLWMIGLCCGLCGAVKYTAAGVVLAIGLNLVVASRRSRIDVLARRLGLVALAAGLAVLPGLAENWLTTGNPVYPFFSLAGIYWDEWRRWWYDRPGTGLMATAPARLVFALLEASAVGTEGTSLYGATIGPVLVPGVFMLFAVWRFLNAEERALAGHMLGFFGVNYAVWLVGLARTALLFQARLLLPAFGVCAVLSGVAWERVRCLNRRRLDVGWIARAVMSLALGLMLFSQVVGVVSLGPLRTVLGAESRTDYLTRRLGWYYVVVEELNRDLSPDSKVLFLWEPRTYHCQVECVPDALLDRWLHTTRLYGYDADVIAEAWRAEGVTHVLVYETGLEQIVEAAFDPVTRDDLRVLDELLVRHMTRVETWDEHYALYELTR